MTDPRPLRLVREGAVLLVFAVIATMRFSPALTTWFIFDDPRALFYSTRPLGEVFLSRMYAPSYYTPLLGLTLRPDILLFGLHPAPYHVHNAAVVVGIAWVLYLIVRRCAPDRVTAMAPGLVILLSSPALVSVFWITLRQYLYAVLFALVAVHLHLGRTTAPRPRLLATAAILLACELSFLGKEQFMTLPAVLLLLTRGSFRQRLRLTYPYFVVLALHAALRYHVLGGVGGGPQALELNLPGYLAAGVMSLPWTAVVIFGSPLALLIVLGPWLRRWRALLMGLGVWTVSLAVAFLAMNTLPSTSDQRYWLQATVLFAVALALGAAWIRSAVVRSGYLALLLIWLATHAVTTGRALNGHFLREGALAFQLSRAVVRPDLARGVILWPATTYAHSDYLAHMARLYQRDGLAPGPVRVYPRELLVLEPRLLDRRRVYEVSPDDLRDAPETILRDIRATHASRVMSAKPRVGFRVNAVLHIKLDCPGPDPGVTLFSFRGSQFQFVDTSAMPYRHAFSTGLIVDRRVRVTLVPIAEVLFGKAGPHDDSGAGWTELSAYAVACRYPDGRSTILSDAVLVERR